MEKEVNYYINFFDGVEDEDFQIDMEVYNKIYEKAGENDNEFKEERLNEKNVNSYTLTLYQKEFIEIINEIIKNIVIDEITK